MIKKRCVEFYRMLGQPRPWRGIFSVYTESPNPHNAPQLWDTELLEVESSDGSPLVFTSGSAAGYASVSARKGAYLKCYPRRDLAEVAVARKSLKPVDHFGGLEGGRGGVARRPGRFGYSTCGSIEYTLYLYARARGVELPEYWALTGSEVRGLAKAILATH